MKPSDAIVAGKTILQEADQTGNGIDYPEGKRVAVMANPTGIIGGTQLVDSLWKRGVNIVKVFGPGHGFRGDTPAGTAVKEENAPPRAFPLSCCMGIRINLPI